jgi:hypothetical protein
MASYMTGQKVFVIKTFHFSCGCNVAVVRKYHREISVGFARIIEQCEHTEVCPINVRGYVNVSHLFVRKLSVQHERQ